MADDDPRAGLQGRREALVEDWKAALAPTGYIPLAATEQRAALHALTSRLVDVLTGEPFTPEGARTVGRELVALGWSHPRALGSTLDVLARHLHDGDAPGAFERVGAALAQVADGFAEQMTERILAEQETIREALLAQRDQATEALRESEARFRAIFTGSPVGIAVADMQGRILAANPALEAILGFSEDEMRGRVILAELAHPEDSEAATRAFISLARGETEAYQIEARYLARDGRTVWTQLAMALVRDAEGRPRFAIGMGQDVTEARHAEAERIELLREQAARVEAEAARERLSLLADVSAQLASSLDYEATLQGVARSVVPRVADWCSLNLLDERGNLRAVASGHSNPQRQRAATSMRQRYPRSVEERQSPAVQVLLSGRSMLVSEVDDSMLQAISRDEQQLQFWREQDPRSVIIVPLRGQRGVLGTLSLITTADSGRRYDAADLAVAEDLARRAALAVENAQLYRQAQAAIETAEQAVRAREDFLSVAAHELKTPVTSLRGFAQLTLRVLNQDAELDRDRLRHALTIVDQQSDKLRRLVAQLLDVSRVESGRLALELRTVDLTQLVSEVAASFLNTSPNHALRVTAADTIEVCIDPLRIEQVLTNLVDNAIKHSPQGGQIDVSVARAGADHVQVVVRDHGPGIPPQHRAHIFERFYQANSNVGYAAGMGLGLYISREIVELHGGTIEAQFPQDGGARFVITLPARPLQAGSTLTP